MLKKCIHTTPLSELLLDRGIIYSKNKRKGYKRMLEKDGIELGYFSATDAHNKFILEIKTIQYLHKPYTKDVELRY